jgi:hypothetical protein
MAIDFEQEFNVFPWTHLAFALDLEEMEVLKTAIQAYNGDEYEAERLEWILQMMEISVPYRAEVLNPKLPYNDADPKYSPYKHHRKKD